MEKITNKKGERPYKRRARNILIHKPMQREFTFVMIALLMVATLAIGFVIHETIRDAAFVAGFRFGKMNPYEVLSDVSYQLIMRVSAILFVTLIVISVFGVFFLHRIAGPVYRFRQIFIRLGKGEVPNPIKLREGDFFTETAVEVNRFLQRLSQDREKQEQIQVKLSEMISQGGAAESLIGQAKEIQGLLRGDS